MNEYQRVKKAKICRGIYIEEMKLKERIKNIMGYFLPVFLLSLERAYNLAIAMETKGYRKKKRKLKWDLKRLDYLTFYMFIGYLILIIGGR
jgi:energy-coupling factor transporter transmembrane protein EcfT